MNLSLHRIVSKVNGLEQPFHLCGVHCLLFTIPDGVGGDRETGWVLSGLQVVLLTEEG